MTTIEQPKPAPTELPPDEPTHAIVAGPRRVGAEGFLNALKYVARACPKMKDQPDLAFVIIRHDTERKRIELCARDGNRWHRSFVPAPGALYITTSALTQASVRNAIRDIDHAVKRNKAAMVSIDAASEWDVHYGAPAPIAIECAKLGKAPKDWEPPAFKKAEGYVAAALDGYQSRHMSEAQSWPGGARVKRDEMDASGRRHLNLVDTDGFELAHAVVMPMGITDGLPESKQTEIDSTLSPPGVADSKRTKAKAEKKPKSKTVTVTSSKGTNKTVAKAKSKTRSDDVDGIT